MRLQSETEVRAKASLKICGLMRAEDVRMCGRLGVDICGFVTEYPLAVPWNLTKEQCAALLRQLSPNSKSCIVTGGSLNKILDLAWKLRPDYVQLHYKETPEDVKNVIRGLEPLGIKVIKSIPFSWEDRLEQFGREDVAYCVQSLCEIGTDILLVDSRCPANAEAKGSLADTEFFIKVKSASSVPVMLGGGITPDNCRDIIKNFHPEIIDIMTGVEMVPGVKSEEKIAAVIGQLSAHKG